MSGFRLSGIFGVTSVSSGMARIKADVDFETSEEGQRASTVDPLGLNGLDDVTPPSLTTLDVMCPANVRKRTDADRSRNDIRLLDGVTVKKRKL